MPEKADPKISTSEVVLVGLLLLILDAIDLIPFAGDLTDVAAAPLLLYYHMKHINGVVYGIACVLDLIPGTQEIPTRTIVWVGTVLLDRVAPKKVEQAIESVGGAAEGSEGAPGELEGAGELSAETTQGAASAEGIQAGSTQEAAVAAGGGSEEGRLSSSDEDEYGQGQTQRRGSEDEAPPEENTKEGGKDEEEDLMATESEEDPTKTKAKELFEEVDGGANNESSDDEQAEDEASEAAPKPAGKTVSIDSSPKFQENRRGRDGQKRPNTADIISPQANQDPKDIAA